MLDLTDKLVQKTIKIENLFQDPNNPRFFDFEDEIGIVSDERIPEERVQQYTLEKISRFDIRELKDSIAEVGYLPMDKMVVRSINEKDYVVVEGNRRLAAIKTLLFDHGRGRTLPDELLRQLSEISVLVLDTNIDSVSRDQLLLAGLRHITGVKSWGPYQRAIALRTLKDQMDGNVTAAGNALGIGPTNANRLLRALRALENLQGDDEYGEFAKPSMFSYFEEVMKSPSLRDSFLSWNTTSQEFSNVENLKMFYSWIFPDEGQEAKITRGAEIRDLAKIVSDEEALEEFKKPHVSLPQALSMTDEMRRQDWERPLRKAIEALNTIPVDV
jgi:hypothetical protein